MKVFYWKTITRKKKKKLTEKDRGGQWEIKWTFFAANTISIVMWSFAQHTLEFFDSYLNNYYLENIITKNSFVLSIEYKK